MFARSISSIKDQRVAASEVLKGPSDAPVIATRASSLSVVRIDPRVTAQPASLREEAPFRVSAVNDYVTRTTAAIDSGALRAFTERELSRRTEVFGDLAQVFSAYERSADAGEAVRGINSMQLVKDGERWWIVALSWTDETERGPLPNRYLR